MNEQILTDEEIENLFEQRKYALPDYKNITIGRVIEKAILEKIKSKLTDDAILAGWQEWHSETPREEIPMIGISYKKGFIDASSLILNIDTRS